MTGCNHVRQYQKDFNRYIATKDYKVRCEHGVRGYCKQCLAAIPEEKTPLVNIDVSPIRATIDAPTINRQVNPNIECKEQSRANTEPYRANLKGNKPFNALDALSEISKFRVLRKSAFYSLQKYCHDYGFKFDFHLFEDAFQEAVAEQYSTGDKATTENYLKGYINKRARKHYARLARQTNNNSLEQILAETFDTGEESFTEINYNPRWKERQKTDDRFKRACKEVFTDRQNKLIDLKLRGYSDERIAGVFNVSRRTIVTDKQKLKLAFTAGVFA